MIAGLLAAWFGKTVGGWIAKALPFIIVFVVGAIAVAAVWKSGFNAAMREHDVLTLQTKLATIEADKEAERQARQDAEIRGAALSDKVAVQDKELGELKNALAGQKGVCSFSLDAFVRLCQPASDGGRKGVVSVPPRPPVVGKTGGGK